ncbi:hypothetical protein HAV21_03595 [Paenarthrobacter sp. MSM-2-10-13]|uniref:hypothetical protein n=1 Tax=Paenarthrobacter sp. MSM-2-10-13 TaxID=2717318 RepID=UPI00141EE368|nr:hypothetical protein [Paenarthrobacter sp. MSM-2-10-13]NHW45982.1 hypothetical protein [Paenarthrobacter sp. MSM-2-10-13]
MTTTKTSFWETNVGKTAKAALYLGASAVVGGFISAMASDPQLFGIVTPIVNIVLVLIKQTFLTPSTPNIGSN